MKEYQESVSFDEKLESLSKYVWSLYDLAEEKIRSASDKRYEGTYKGCRFSIFYGENRRNIWDAGYDALGPIQFDVRAENILPLSIRLFDGPDIVTIDGAIAYPNWNMYPYMIGACCAVRNKLPEPKDFPYIDNVISFLRKLSEILTEWDKQGSMAVLEPRERIRRKIFDILFVIMPR